MSLSASVSAFIFFFSSSDAIDASTNTALEARKGREERGLESEIAN